jgi:hypothetical protein
VPIRKKRLLNFEGNENESSNKSEEEAKRPALGII